MKVKRKKSEHRGVRGLVFNFSSECFAGSKEARFDGTDGNREDLGDLLVVQAARIAEQEDGSVVIIQPVEGPTIHREFLEAKGPGLHHICFEVDDVEASCAAAEAAGVPVLMRGSMMGGEIEFAYVDGSAAGAPYVELARIGPQMQELFDGIKAQSGG